MTPDDVAALDVDVYAAFVEYQDRFVRDAERAARRR